MTSQLAAQMLGAGYRAAVRATGGRCVRYEGIWVGFAAVRLYARGGTTVGDTFVTRWDALPGPELLDHERVHVDQWRHYGLSFALRYLAAGRDPGRNRFEHEAGLRAGGYPVVHAAYPAERRVRCFSGPRNLSNSTFAGPT